MSDVEQPCERCGEPTYNDPPDVCRECKLEHYHDQLERKRCPTCRRIRYANALVTQMRAYLWGDPCSCNASGMSWSVKAKDTDKTKLLADVDAALASSEAIYRRSASEQSGEWAAAAQAEADDVAYARKRIAACVAAASPTTGHPAISVEAYGSASPGCVSMHIAVGLALA